MGVKELKDRYVKVKAVSDEWVKKADTLLKEWKLLDNTVNELNSWVAKDRGAETGENGIHIGRTQKHLQTKGKACGSTVIFFHLSTTTYIYDLLSILCNCPD